MSRSYKKTPIIKDHDSGKWGKRQANKRIRKLKWGRSRRKGWYKKAFCSYEIHDYVSRYSLGQARKKFDEALKDYENNGETWRNKWVLDYKDFDEYVSKSYNKWYKRK